MTRVQCRMKAYIQPFERKLALLEMEALTGATPRPVMTRQANGLYYEVPTLIAPDSLANALAYWETVAGTETRYTTQVLREATMNTARNGASPNAMAQLVLFERDISLPNRRCLRYGPHGIHEYRGKFFPQLVRALINIAGVRPGGLVADPMSGSGTTIVEAALSGCHGLGLDMNPLSVLMGRTKCALLSVNPHDIMVAHTAIRAALLEVPPSPLSASLRYFHRLPARDQEYLAGWFSSQALLNLDRIALAIERVEHTTIRDLMWLSLSNIIRGVSWQKVDDLRVRKEVREDAGADPIKSFLKELGRSVYAVLAFLHQDKGAQLGTYDIHEGDARAAAMAWESYLGQVDAVITSPPYAMALPYLDTDRLSLCYLGLLTRPEHRRRDERMIGNREVTERGRLAHWQLFQQEKDTLSESVVDLIERVDALNAQIGVGFRRRNLPALLAKYFIDMRDVLHNISVLLKPGAVAFVVVGNNHTIAGGQRVDINTAALLSDIAANIGLDVGEHIPMEMLVSRDIFRKNAVASEVILCFRRPS